MTFKEFKADFNGLIGKDTRHDGEVLVDYLKQIWPEEHVRLTSIHYYDETDIDCTLVEALVPNTLKHLETIWWKHIIH